ncbi:MAG TPA: PaaI family thioesterase [Burkholderiaceae bacterium]|nr:PaaI family thioesterase [Burkholderiaceae bacterium]HMX11139.1 PaaI family thioesterase [Burkholderiaceae bacterium]HMY99574.1 PaaI family thioesterase [Burkholderiaceae bacterium]HNB44278.1 PaaI family thioesterase [Burkholderiaceae bacterium]HNG80186.1 PaaI family thioesterase [Burkholderiaceae bacterium]
MTASDPSTTPLPPPDGFTLYSGSAGPWFHALDPVYWREEADGTLTLGLRLQARHGNILGIPHGGMLLTFADSAIGVNLGRAQRRRDPKRAIVTTSLSSDFLGAARIGDWLEARVTVRKSGRTLAFGECLLAVGDRPILRASAVFSVIDRPMPGDAGDGTGGSDG